MRPLLLRLHPFLYLCSFLYLAVYLLVCFNLCTFLPVRFCPLQSNSLLLSLFSPSSHFNVLLLRTSLKAWFDGLLSYACSDSFAVELYLHVLSRALSVRQAQIKLARPVYAPCMNSWFRMHNHRILSVFVYFFITVCLYLSVCLSVSL